MGEVAYLPLPKLSLEEMLIAVRDGQITHGFVICRRQDGQVVWFADPGMTNDWTYLLGLLTMGQHFIMEART